MQKLHFKHFVKTVEATSLKFFYDTGNCNFRSGADNCAEACELLQCACTDLCSFKWRNGNSFYLPEKIEILGVVTSDCPLPDTNRLFKDLFD